jgi:hypothetical protein
MYRTRADHNIGAEATLLHQGIDPDVLATVAYLS